MSTTSIMSVKEMIERSFGNEDSNWVNFRLVQTTLFLLARQLRILERHVTIDVPPETLTVTSSNITVTEVQINNKNPKKTDKVTKERKNTSPDNIVALEGKSSIHAMHGKVTVQGKAQNVKKTKPKDLKTEKAQASSDNLDSISKHRLKKPSENPSFRKSLSDTMTDQSFEQKSTPLLKNKVSSISELKTDEYKKYYGLLEKLEEQRELVLRVIHQRHDSREERMTSPTPMASLERTEMEIEKLLLVETGLRDDEATRLKGPRNLAIVSPQEFKALQIAVEDLQNKFETESPDFPDNIKLMRELRKGGTSLTDAITALQLSARLEAAEKTIQNMTEMLTNFTRQNYLRQKESKARETIIAADSKPNSIKSSSPRKYDRNNSMQDENESENLVTQDQLHTCISELTTEIYTRVNNDIVELAESARNAKEILRKLEKTIQESQGMHKRVEELETLVESYINRLNSIDAGFASQVSIYQEQLTQMHMDLEAGLEEVSEALANRDGGEMEISTELTTFIKTLQDQIERGMVEQKELFSYQEDLSLNLEHVRKEIELLRDTKADRDEVEDAFRDKAGIEHLNGLVNQQEYVAHIEEFEKGINAIHKRIHEEELVWQQAIQDLEDKLDEKVDLLVLESLRASIKENMQILKDKIKYIAEIVGEPKAAALARKLHRDATCLSCAAPAYMDTEQNILPVLPTVRPPKIGAEIPIKETITAGDHMSQSTKDSACQEEDNIMPIQDGDHRGICCRKFRISHPREGRTKVCKRFCGGSHTTMSNLDRIQAAIIVNPLKRETKLMTGTDGKMYIMDEIIDEKPCIPCNIKQPDFVPPVEDPGVIDEFEDLSFNRDARSSFRPSNARTSSFRVSNTQNTSIHDGDFQSGEFFAESIQPSIMGVKSEEFAIDQVTETSVSRKSSPNTSHVGTLNEKPKKSSNLCNPENAMVPSILHFIPEVIDLNTTETVENEQETILADKRKTSKTLTIQDDKHPDSDGSVRYDLAELFEVVL